MTKERFTVESMAVQIYQHYSSVANVGKIGRKRREASVSGMKGGDYIEIGNSKTGVSESMFFRRSRKIRGGT